MKSKKTKEKSKNITESEKYPYQKEWKEYRKRQIILIIAFVGLIPFMVLIFPFIPNSYNIGGLDIRVLCIIFYVIVILVCLYRVNDWKCPRCGKSFNTIWYRRNAISDKCLHCELPRYEGSNIESW